MMRYPYLVFDLYGTLVDIHTDDDAPRVWRKLAMFYGCHGAAWRGPALYKAFTAVMTAQNASAGQSYECYPDLPVEPVLAELFRQKGVTEGLDALAAEAARLLRVCATRYIRLYPGVRPALEALRAAGHKLFLLSNAQAAFTAPELRLLDLERCFDAVYLSSDYRCRKPDRRFFEVLLRTQRLDPAECLMIGNDAATDIAGARGVGMAVLYLHTNLSPEPPAPVPADYAFAGSDWRQILPYLQKEILC